VVEFRKVLYHITKGTFLGFAGDLVDAVASDKRQIWSKDSGLTSLELAPTFLDRDDYNKYLKSHGVKMGDMPVGILIECWPSHPGNLANVDDVANAGLPRWGNK
jgi:hypothetical protein